MPSFLVRNWHLKLLSLAVAAGLWLFVAVGERSQLALAAPVEYVGLPDDAVLLPDPRDRVELQVEVGRWAVSRLTSEALRVRAEVPVHRERRIRRTVQRRIDRNRHRP